MPAGHVEPVDGEHGEVLHGVEVHDPAGARPAALELDDGLAHSRDDVGVGHDAPGRDDEATPGLVLAALEGGARDAQD